MNENTKTWMIEAGDVLEVMTPKKPQPATATINKSPRPAPQPAPAAAPGEPARRRVKTAPARKSRMHFAILMALTYLLGPLSVLLTPRGRQQQKTMILAALSVMATVALLLEGFGGLVRNGHPASVWAWLGLLAIAIAGGFTAWARAVHLLASEGLPSVNKLPYWLRRKWSVSLLGLVAPGAGLLLGGHSRRAAVTLWLFGPVVAAVVILLNGLGLWQHHLASGWLAESGPVLEMAIMTAAGVVLLGFLAYFAQALEGARQVLVEPGLQKRVKGDYYALAVVAAVVVMVVAVNPVRMAQQVAAGGEILAAEGFQMIPLQLNLAARHLDAGRPEYALRAAELYTALGETERAAALRAELDQSLGAYVALVQKEAVADYALAQAETAQRKRTRPVDVAEVAPQAAAIPDRAEKSDPTQNLDPTQLMGTMVGGKENTTNPSHNLGLPDGPGFFGDDADLADPAPRAPQK